MEASFLWRFKVKLSIITFLLKYENDYCFVVPESRKINNDEDGNTFLEKRENDISLGYFFFGKFASAPSHE